MKKIRNYIIVIAAVLIGACSVKDYGGIEEPDVRADTNMLVAMDIDMPGYFDFNGETFGYQYEILREYASYAGKDIRLVSGGSPAKYRKMLKKNSIDMAVMLKNHVDGNDIAVEVYKTSYVVLARKKDARAMNISRDKNICSALNGHKLLISHGFTSTKSYDVMLDSLKGAAYLSSQNIFELIDDLGTGKIDFLVCERTEAQLASSLMRNISIAYEFDEKVPVYVIFDGENAAVAEDFSGWLSGFSLTEGHMRLERLYFQQGISAELLARGLKEKPRGQISAYDEIFRKVCAEENVDWRMIAAIAYVESHFNNHMVSSMGARGLMQVMPVVADEFGVPREDLMDPEINVRLAVKLIKWLGKYMKISDEADFEDKMSIILACYNGGHGHVIDARRLAVKYGTDPDSWDEVSQYLLLKSQEEYAADEVVRNGRFSGGKTTIAFVSKVMEKYDSYCLRAES